jgi:hypothetical protein
VWWTWWRFGRKIAIFGFWELHSPPDQIPHQYITFSYNPFV